MTRHGVQNGYLDLYTCEHDNGPACNGILTLACTCVTATAPRRFERRFGTTIIDSTTRGVAITIRNLISIGLSFCLLALGSQSYAQMTFRLGVTAWTSDGETSWNHDASAIDPRLGNPCSELTYKKVKSNVIEVSGRWQGERLYTKAAYGVGDASDGTLVDDDFVSASGAAFFGTSVSGAHRFSRTHSEIDGDDLSYINLTVGGQIWRTTTRKGHLNIYAGYQKWKEKYVAKGLEQIECTAPGVLCAPAGFVGFTGQRVITNEVEWESIFVGVNGTIQVSRRVALSGDIAYTPKAKMHNEDIHHLRTDLRKDPSFEMSGDGSGWNVEATATIKIKKNLSAYIGFRD